MNLKESKKNRMEVRLTENEAKILDKISEKLQLSKSEILVKGLMLMNDEKYLEKERLLLELRNALSINDDLRRCINKNCQIYINKDEAEKVKKSLTVSLDTNELYIELLKRQLKKEFNYDI